MTDKKSINCELLTTISSAGYMMHSYAFHPSAPIVATVGFCASCSSPNTGGDYVCASSGGCRDNLKLWSLSDDGTRSVCMVTMPGDNLMVIFDPTGRFMATVNVLGVVKLWRISPEGNRVTYVATLNDSINYITSVTFDPTGNFLASGSLTNSAKIWRVSPDDNEATCVATLSEHRRYTNVKCVAFDPTGRFLATGSSDRTAKLWLLGDDYRNATCVSTLEHRDNVESVAFHPFAPYLATTDGKITKLWKLSSDGRTTSCVANLQGNADRVGPIAFHPGGQFLAIVGKSNTRGNEGIIDLWLLNPDYNGATCVSTFRNPSYDVLSVAFHASLSLLGIVYYSSADTMLQIYDCDSLTRTSQRLRDLSLPKLLVHKMFRYNQRDGSSTDETEDFRTSVLKRTDKIPVLSKKLAAKEAAEAVLEMEEVNGGRMSRQKHKISNRKYKKRALRRSRK